MAIFPEYAMPKYKSPIRITKPYQKPNYLADAIIGGIGAYTNMQGMNLKKQMFMAQMAQQQKAIADKQARYQMEADIYTQQRTVPDRTDAGIQGYLGDAGPNFTQPMGISAVDKRVAAALAGGANPMRPISIAQALYPTPKPTTVSKADLRYQTAQQRRFDQEVKVHMTNVFGDLLQGEATALTTRFPGTEKMLQSNPIKTENQFLSGKSLLDATLSDVQFLPGWDTGGEENPGYQTSRPNPNYQEPGAIGFRVFLEEKIKPLVQQMMLDKKTPGEIQIALRRIRQQAMGTEGKDVFNYNSIAQMLNQNRGIRSTQEANAIITGQ